jgi:hypothetical protein
MILDIVFVRHGVSCANAWSRKSYGMHLLYPDPELTKGGIDLSKALSALLIKHIEQRWGSELYSVGASRMIRAQETAYYMIASTFGLPINVMAHVGEEGVTTDNYSLPIADQVKILMGRNPGIVDLLLKGRDGREPQNLWTKANFGKFLIWAEKHPEYFVKGSDGHHRAVIFTHSHFLKHAFHMPMVLANNDAIHTVIDTSADVGLIRYEIWPFNLSSAAESCPDGCKPSVCNNAQKTGGLRKKGRPTTRRNRR